MHSQGFLCSITGSLQSLQHLPCSCQRCVGAQILASHGRLVVGQIKLFGAGVRTWTQESQLKFEFLKSLWSKFARLEYACTQELLQIVGETAITAHFASQTWPS